MTELQHDPKNESLELTEGEQKLIAAIRAGNRQRALWAMSRLTPSEWTYEKRAAFHILACLALEGVLADEVIDSPHSNGFGELVDQVGDALIDALHILGCPDTLSLAQILDRASSFSEDES